MKLMCENCKGESEVGDVPVDIDLVWQCTLCGRRWTFANFAPKPKVEKPTPYHKRVKNVETVLNSLPDESA